MSQHQVQLIKSVDNAVERECSAFQILQEVQDHGMQKNSQKKYIELLNPN